MSHQALTTYRAILAAASEPAGPRVRIPTSDRGYMMLQRDPVTLQRWAEIVLKNWSLYGGGPKPAEIAKPARKVGTAWSATMVQVWREQIEAGELADATRIGLEKLGARFYVNGGRPAVCIVAPKPVEGMPAEFASGRRDDGKWVTFDLVSGVAIGARGALTRAAAEKDARQQWAIRTEDARAMALRIARRDNPGTQAAALAAWCQVHGIDPGDIPAALADVSAADVDATPIKAADAAPMDAAPMATAPADPVPENQPAFVADPAQESAPAAAPSPTPAAPPAAAPTMPRRMPDAMAILADAVASSSARPAPDGDPDAAAGDPPASAGPGPASRDPAADAPARGARPLASAQEHSIPAPGGTPYGGIPDPAPAAPAGQSGPDAAELVARSRPGLWLAAWLAIRRMLSAGPAIRPRGAAPARDAPRRGARPASSAPGARWRGPGGIPYGGICSDGVVLSPRIVSPPGDHPQAPGFSPTAAPAVEFPARRRPESSRAKREQPANARAALEGAGCRTRPRPMPPSTAGAAFALAIGRPWPDGWPRTVAGRSAAGLARFGHAWTSGTPPSIATSRALQGDEWYSRRDTYRSSALAQPLPGARAGLAGIGRPAGGWAWVHRAGASGGAPGAFPAVCGTPPPTLYSDIGAPSWRAPGAFSALAGLPAACPPTPYGDIRHPLIPAKDRP